MIPVILQGSWRYAPQAALKQSLIRTVPVAAGTPEDGTDEILGGVVVCAG